MRPSIRSITRRLAGVGLFSLAAGCTTLGLEGVTSERSRLRANRAKWEQHQLSSYRFTYRLGCFCPERTPVSIEVRDDVVTHASTQTTDEALPLYLLGHIPTVDSLFAIVERAIVQRADLLEVDYHHVLGYPTRIAIDYEFNTADDEIVYYASGLTALFDQ